MIYEAGLVSMSGAWFLYWPVRPVRGQYGRCVVLALAGAAGAWFIRTVSSMLLPTRYSRTLLSAVDSTVHLVMITFGEDLGGTSVSGQSLSHMLATWQHACNLSVILLLENLNRAVQCRSRKWFVLGPLGF